MKAGVKSICLILLLLAAVFTGSPSLAQDPGVEPVGSSGVIDWVGGKVIATGIGVPRTDVIPAKARAMAERASLVVARRNLLEVIQGVHIDSRTTVENFLVRDDSVVARVNGEIKLSHVERVEHFGDGTVMTTVSLSLGGNLNGILVKMVSGASPPSPAGMADVDNRLRTLEERVRLLEQEVTGLKRTSFRQEELIFLFKQVVAAWRDHTADTRPWRPAGFDAAGDSKRLEIRLRGQETRLNEISRRLDEMAGRVDALSASPASAPQISGKPPEATVPYTGLVIDARGTGFRPCLKPVIYGRKDPVYPGRYIILEEAIRRGYVRYYREVGGAQQSRRAGRLPLTIKATGTLAGQRSLQIGDADAERLTAISGVSGNFLSRCQVVIVF
jgi:uncharacterized coiled-coil protein SlyX